jgi:hypothetical protein
MCVCLSLKALQTADLEAWDDEGRWDDGFDDPPPARPPAR